MRKKRYEMTDAVCPECGEKGPVVLEDNSFSHEFGIQEDYRWVMACCECPPPDDWEPEEYVPDYDPVEEYERRTRLENRR